MSPIPEGRVVRDPEDVWGILLDNYLYGESFVHTPIPEWWGSLNHIVADALARPITEDDRRILEGKTPGECRETAGDTRETA